MIQFNENTELTIVTGYDVLADNITEERTEVFRKGEPVDADVISEDGDYVDLEFADGVATGVLRSCFTELREHRFSPHTNLCKFCGCHANDDAVASEPCLPKE